MTTDKPGAVAMEAAALICANYQLEDRWAENIAVSVQAAIDRETAAVAAELESRDAALTSCKLTAGRWQQERDEARAERETWKTQAYKTAEDYDEARAAARDIRRFAQHTHVCGLRKSGCSCGMEVTLAKHAALLAEPEGGG